MTGSSAGDDASRAQGLEPSFDTPPRRRLSRIGIAMVIVGALLMVGAIPFVVIGLQHRSDAADARAAAQRARAARPALAKRAGSYERQRASLQAQVDSFPTKMTNMREANREVLAAEGVFVDTVQRAIQAHNSGDVAGAVALFQTDGQTAIAALTQKNNAAEQAIKVAQDAVQALKGATG